MEDKSPKRRGRPRKAVPGVDDAGSNPASAEIVDGVGQAGDAGVAAPEPDDTEQGEGVSWHELVAIACSINKWDRRISCLVHPEAVGIVDCPGFGGIRTEVGSAGYVLSNSERIEL